MSHSNVGTGIAYFLLKNEEIVAMIFGKDLSILKRLMDYRIFRQGVLSSNIANIDTPGYKAKDLEFSEELDAAMQGSRVALEKTNPRHIGSSLLDAGYKVVRDPYSRIGNDSNTVDIDREMVKLTENHILYNATARIVQQKLEWIKNTIGGIR